MKAPAILFLLVVGVTLGGAAEPALAQATQGETRPVVGDFFTDRALLVSGWSPEDLDKILGDFASKYKDDLPRFRHVILTNGAVKRVSLPDDLRPELLSFLVNYVHYPEGFDLKGRNIVAIGTATLSRDFNAPPAEDGKKAYFYIPSNDEDYDLVYIRVGDHTYAQSFTTMEWKQVKDSRLSATAKALMP